MTSTGYPPGSPMPIQLAPDLDPADAAHIPRWLDELWQVEHVAAGFRRAPLVDLTPEEAAKVEAYVRAKWVEPSQEGET